MRLIEAMQVSGQYTHPPDQAHASGRVAHIRYL